MLVQSEKLAVEKDLPLLCLQNKVNFHQEINIWGNVPLPEIPRLLIRIGEKYFLLNKTSLKIDFDQTYFLGNIFSTKTNLRRKVFSMKYNFDKLEFR